MCTETDNNYSDNHATQLIQQMHAEGPAVGSTRTLSYVNHLYGICQKEGFFEPDAEVATFAKRIRAEAGPNELSSDIPNQKLINRFALENSLLYYYSDIDNTAANDTIAVHRP